MQEVALLKTMLTVGKFWKVTIYLKSNSLKTITDHLFTTTIQLFTTTIQLGLHFHILLDVSVIQINN